MQTPRKLRLTAALTPRKLRLTAALCEKEK